MITHCAAREKEVSHGKCSEDPPQPHGEILDFDFEVNPAQLSRNEKTSRNVLVIASRFPPVASVGAIRVRKFVKYLGQYGWRPVVITGAMRPNKTNSQDVRRATDEDSLQDLPPGLQVFRSGMLADNWPASMSQSLGHLMAPSMRWLGFDQQVVQDALKWRFQRLHDRLSFPDRGIWRLPSVVNIALRLNRRFHFDAIFSTGMPFSDHLIALVLRRIFRRPWLADFRDPWVDYIHWQQWQSDLGRRLTRVAEATVVRNASSVISVNEEMGQRFAARYRRQPAEKFVTISNGFDPCEYVNVPKREDTTTFRMVYAGSLYGKRSPDRMLEAFRRFIQSVPGSRDRAQFDFLGRPGPYIDKLNDPADEGRVRYLGMVSHSDALKAMVQADLNVILLPNAPGSENDSTAKLYECLGCRRPILAAVPTDGAAARILRPFDGVTLCDPDAVDDIVAAITDWYGRWLGGHIDVTRSKEALLPLTRRYQAGQLAQCLDAAVGVNRAAKRGAA